MYADLIMCYKIVFGLVDLHMYDFFALSTATHSGAMDKAGQKQMPEASGV